jgi:hypothetical protein
VDILGKVRVFIFAQRTIRRCQQFFEYLFLALCGFADLFYFLAKPARCCGQLALIIAILEAVPRSEALICNKSSKSCCRINNWSKSFQINWLKN